MSALPHDDNITDIADPLREAYDLLTHIDEQVHQQLSRFRSQVYAQELGANPAITDRFDAAEKAIENEDRSDTLSRTEFEEKYLTPG